MTQRLLLELLSIYREGAEGTSSQDPKVANRWQRKMHASYKQLRETEEGRAGIMEMMNDPSPHVRCWSAAHSLQWKPDVAEQVLRKLVDSQSNCSFTAEITLEEYHKGNLSFNY